VKRSWTISLVAPLLAALVWMGISVHTIRAEGDHVEYMVPDQSGITVVQHGESGLVEVTACVISGKSLKFMMDVTLPEGFTDLTIRHNGGDDVTDWVQVDPSHLNAPGGAVSVFVTVPSGATESGTVRIQEIGDPPAPGGHHGVKVQVCNASSPEPTKTPVPPTATATSVVSPTATKTPVRHHDNDRSTATRTPTATVTPGMGGSATWTIPTSTSTSTQQIKLPLTGTGPEDSGHGFKTSTKVVGVLDLVLAVVLVVMGIATFVYVPYRN